MNTETNTETLSLESIAAEFNAAGVPAYVAQSGGGCATVYVGPWYRDAEGDQIPAWMVGPGWFDGPNETQANCWRDEVSFGDGFGILIPNALVAPTDDETAGAFARRCLAAIAEHGTDLAERAADCGWNAYNGIG